MDYLEAVIVGVLQGVFEWLPVSSEAIISLVLTSVGSTPSESINSAVFLHTGTMLAALIYFRDDYMEMIQALPGFLKRKYGSGDYRVESVLGFLIVSTMFTGAIGFAGYVFLLDMLPESPKVFSGLIGVMLVLTGLGQMYSGSRRGRWTNEVNSKDAALAGTLQGLSVVPGISRSGSTVFGLLYRGFDSESAFRLSFLMSVPAVLGANVFLNLNGFNYASELIVASAVSAVVGYLSIGTVLKIAEKFKIEYMCFVLAGLSFIGALI